MGCAPPALGDNCTLELQHLQPALLPSTADPSLVLLGITVMLQDTSTASKLSLQDSTWALGCCLMGILSTSNSKMGCCGPSTL